MNTYKLPRTQPEQQGIASSAIIEFIQSVEAESLELHSFMLLKHGNVVAEGWWDPYTAKLPHMLFSLSKSFTSTAIGLAVAEGIVSLDDQVISFFPNEIPSEISANLSAMQIRHLLMMGTGHAEDTMGFLDREQDGNWAKAFLGVPVEHEPGTHFLYNTGATYMLSAIIQKVSKLKLLDYLKPRLLQPLSIENATWEECPRGINTGGFGLSITTEDIAKFGQLYLQNGAWNGQQLLHADWIKEATSKQISNGEGGDNDWSQGYGYQFWVSQHKAYRGDGAFGQYCVVLPEQDAVIAITAGLGDMQIVLNNVWNILLPALKSESIPMDEHANASLQAVLSNLKLDPPQLQLKSAQENALSGQTFSFEVSESPVREFSINFESDKAIVVLTTSMGRDTIHFGRESWLAGAPLINEVMANHKASSSINSSFTWLDEATLELTIRYIETPFYHTLVCRFNNEEILLDVKLNVGFGPKEFATIHGKRV